MTQDFIPTSVEKEISLIDTKNNRSTSNIINSNGELTVENLIRDTIPSFKLTLEQQNSIENCLFKGYTLEEACLKSNVDRKKFKMYLKNNPELSERLDALAKNTTMLAKENIFLAISAGDNEMSKWFLERKEKQEFSKNIIKTTPQEIEENVSSEDKELLEEYASKILKRKRTITEEIEYA